MSNHDEENVVEFYEYIFKKTREGCRAIKFDQLMYMKLYLDDMYNKGVPMKTLAILVDNFKKILYED